MTVPVVRSETAGGVCTVTLDDPGRKSTLSAQLTSELMDALDAAEADDVGVIVLTNTGNTFCAGANLSERSGRSEASSLQQVDPAEMFARWKIGQAVRRQDQRPLCRRWHGLVLAMDHSVVLDTAKMGFTEVRIGVAPAMISVLCLPKMRASDARAAFLRGNRFLASEAERMGIINRAVRLRDRCRHQRGRRRSREGQPGRTRSDEAVAGECAEHDDRRNNLERCPPSCSRATTPRRAWLPPREVRRPGSHRSIMMDFDFPADDDPRRLAVRAWRDEISRTDTGRTARGRLCRAALARPWGSAPTRSTRSSSSRSSPG